MNPLLKCLATAVFFIFTTIIALILAFIVAALVLYDRTFSAPYPDIKAVQDPAVIERGKYLVFGPARCADCHASLEQKALVDAGKEAELSGGPIISTFLGDIISTNITSDPVTGIGKISDGELARFLRTGIDHRGQVGLPIMTYANLSTADLTAIISYLRTTAPVNHFIQKGEYNLLGKITKAFFLKPFAPESDPPPTPVPAMTAEYGEYLVNQVANCGACHTERNMHTGEYIGEPLAGGMVFQNAVAPGEKVISPNLTPDRETGRIVAWNQDVFTARFRLGSRSSWSPMPWGSFSRMTEDDLGAIYLYLNQLPPAHKENVLPTEKAVEK